MMKTLRHVLAELVPVAIMFAAVAAIGILLDHRGGCDALSSLPWLRCAP